MKNGLLHHYNSASSWNKMLKSILSTLALDVCETWSQRQLETLIEDRKQDHGKNISPT